MATCRQCGAVLGEGKLAGVCPRCMLLDALSSAPELAVDTPEAGEPELLPGKPEAGAPEVPSDLPSSSGRARRPAEPSAQGQQEPSGGPGRTALPDHTGVYGRARRPAEPNTPGRREPSGGPGRTALPDHTAVYGRAGRPAEPNTPGQQEPSGPKERRPGTGRHTLEVRCPQCGHMIELAAGAALSGVCCDSCGTRFNIVDEAAVTEVAADLGKIGPFQILEKLGSGSFGTVWKARDSRLDRLVAIKVPLHRQLPPAEAEKFLREARAAAQLHHPNIVSVHEVGRDEELIYIVCDFVEGVSLADWLSGQRMGAHEAAAFCVQLADALEHAHEAGVIHRDLKPQNVILDGQGKPHLTDFGLARREAGEATVTVDGALLGTPAYMSPEQARGEAHQADRRTDIYSLGVILFQLLTGELPFRGNARMLVHQVIHDEPPNPRKLNAHIPKDLETICLKGMAKEPHRRYATAGEFRDDLRRFLNGEPIRARPISALDRTVRWCRRKPTLAGALGVVVALAVVSTVAAVRMAIEREGRARELYRASIQLAERHIREGAVDLALATLLDCPQKYRHWEWGYLMAECHREVRVFDDAVVVKEGLPLLVSQERWSCAFDRTGDRVAALSPARGVWIWDIGSGELLSHTRHPAEVGVGLKLTPDWTEVVYATTNGIEIAPLDPSKPVRRLEADLEALRTLAVSPDGSTLAALAVRDRIQTWDLPSGESLASFATPIGSLRLHFTGDGQRLVVAGADWMAVYEAASGRLLYQADDGGQGAIALFPSPKGDRFLTADATNRFQLWSTNGWVAELGEARCSLVQYARTAVFSLDGQWFSTGGDNLSASVRHAATGRLRMTIPGQAYLLCPSPDGRHLATVGGSTVIQVWDLEECREVLSLSSIEQDIQGLNYSPDGRLLTSISGLGHLKVWSALPGRELIETPGYVSGTSVSGDGHYAATAEACGADLIVWDTHTGATLATLRRERRPAWEYCALSPDGRRLAVGTVGCEILVWEPHTGELLQVLSGHSAATTHLDYSPDGRLLVSANLDHTARIWDAETGDTLHVLQGHTDWVYKAVFSRDGERIVAVSRDKTGRIWDVATGRCLHVLRGHTEDVTAVAIAPDNRTVATAGYDRTLRLWDLRSGRLLDRWELRGGCYMMDYSPDGRRLVLRNSRTFLSATDRPSVEVWDTVSAQPLLGFRGHAEAFTTGLFSPDGRRVLADWWDTKVRQWEAFPWREEEYPEVAEPRSEGGGQRTDCSRQRAEGGGQRPEQQSRGTAEKPAGSGLTGEKGRLALRIRRYADRYWKDRLAAERQGALAGPALNVVVPWDRSEIAPRDPAASPHLIDLTKHYTSPINELSHPTTDGTDWGANLQYMPRGIVSFHGTTFDVRGIIQLRRRQSGMEVVHLGWNRIPERVESIPFGQRFGRLHALLGTDKPAPEGRTIGWLIWHYADGSQHSCLIDYGRHVRDYWTDHDPRTDTSQARLAWEGIDPVPNWGGPRTRLRVYQCYWDNPEPELEVVNFDFVSALTTSAPFLIAVTVE